MPVDNYGIPGDSSDILGDRCGIPGDMGDIDSSGSNKSQVDTVFNVLNGWGGIPEKVAENVKV